ncbi:hypothetical protein EYF80_049826 [Liparis tanakae]|uniref:Uncharacterized protein n=1 Tax=Liparis tanakae TaxID=230148 RepID=A0A4Z2FFK3_9TELE|nr:hypothetical protein EYF80_049826 [Liparis tanakae]
MTVKRALGPAPLTSLHQHGDLAALGALAEQVDHLVVRHALHVPLVDLHDDVALLQAAAARVIHDLLHALPAAAGAVGDGEAEALVALLHVHGDELGLRGDGGRQRDHVAGVAAVLRGRGGGRVGVQLRRRAVGPREPVERRPAVRRAVVAAVAAVRRAVAAGRRPPRLAVDDDGVLVVRDGHRGHHAGVGVVGVEGQRVAAAQLQVHHGADGDGLEDLHHLGVRVAQHAHDSSSNVSAAGPSSTRLLICRNSSGSSPPTTVKPKPRRLFFSLVLMKVPLSSARFRIPHYSSTFLHLPPPPSLQIPHYSSTFLHLHRYRYLITPPPSSTSIVTDISLLLHLPPPSSTSIVWH